jgi:signal transduction histidine kinase
VLHNVGNVLNSVNVSTSLLTERVRKSKVTDVGRIARLLKEHESDLGDFFSSDPKAQQIPVYLDRLFDHLAAEQSVALEELTELGKHIDHIKQIVAMQQGYAKVAGVTTMEDVLALVEDALRMNEAALERHGVSLVREYHEPLPKITVDRHKVMQILLNLIRNAKYACDEGVDKLVTVRVIHTGQGIQIAVTDNGVGIPAENLSRIFSHGFTTRKNGHGFGLHSGALAAREMGGELRACSDGPGKGATFVLELPIQPPARTRGAAGLKSIEIQRATL